jgi:hypothetical protein
MFGTVSTEPRIILGDSMVIQQSLENVLDIGQHPSLNEAYFYPIRRDGLQQQYLQPIPVSETKLCVNFIGSHKLRVWMFS